MVKTAFYLLIRASAITLGGACTWYSATTSWHHYHDLVGPLAAVSAAALFIFCEHAWRDRYWHHAGILTVLGVLAAIISGSVVLMRNADTQAAKLHAAQSANLPRALAKQAVDEARTRYDAAKAAVLAETKDRGCGPACRGLKKEAAAALDALNAARTKQASLGAEIATNTAASVLGAWGAPFNRAMAVAPAIWLELAAPALLAFGFAPWPRKRKDPAIAAIEDALRAEIAAKDSEIAKLKRALKNARKKAKQANKPANPPPAKANPKRSALKVVGGSDA